MAFVPNSGSVVAFQGNPSVLQATVGLMSTNASVITVGTAAANQSVSGTVGASVIGTVPVTQVTDPWRVTANNASIIVLVQGSVATTAQAAANQSVSGTVGASVVGWVPIQPSNTSTIGVIQGSVAVAIVSGSVAVATGNSSVQVLNFPANQSVSGTVGASVIGWVPIQASNTSVISYVQNSVATVIIGGSIATATTNSSVMLLNGANVIGSVTALQGTNPWVIATHASSIIVLVQGSVATTQQAAANQSVSGTVGASVIGWIPIQPSNTSTIGVIQGSIGAVIIGGSIATATTNSSVMLLNGANVIGSVTTLQGTNPWVGVNVGSIITTPIGSTITVLQTSSLIGVVTGSVVTLPTGNQSVSGTIGASIIGIGPVTLTANTIPASALAFLGATTSITAANSSVVTVTGYPRVHLQITSNPSMTGTILFEGSSDNSSWLPITGQDQATNALASVTTIADSNWSFNVAGLQTFRARLASWTAGSVTGKVYLSPVDARPTAFVGSVSAAISNTNINVSGSVAAFVQGTPNVNTAGSVVAFPGTNPWPVTAVGSIISLNIGSIISTNIGSIITVFKDSSILAVPVGSVITVIQGSSILAVPVGSTIAVLQANSIVGTYAEDAVHTTADKGIFMLGVRNDAVSSITSAERDYSPIAVDETGRNIVVPFAGQQACIISYVSSLVSGSVTLIQGSVIGSRSYITDVFLSNTYSVATLVTLQGGDTSLIGQFIVPAGGGYSAPGINIPLRTTLSQDLAWKAVPSASVIHLTLKGYQAP